MRFFRLLFAPELGRPLAEALHSAEVLRTLIGAVRRPGPAVPGSGVRPPGSRWLAAVLLALALAGLGLTAIPPPDPAAAQSIERGLFADTDSTTREVLAFLGGLGAHGPSAVGDMLFAFNTGVLVLAGFLLIWHAAAGTVDTAREGRFGFGAWAIVRIVTAVALMAPLPGGLNGGAARRGRASPISAATSPMPSGSRSPRRRWPRAAPSCRAPARRSGALRSRAR